MNKPTVPDNLVFLSAQPIDIYFLWQVEVQIVNFRKFGISDKMQVLVWFPLKRAAELEGWKKLQEKYPEVRIFAYADRGVNLGLYISQLRPHILKQHFTKYKEELKDKIFFYHDSDIIFRELPDFNKLAEGDIVWQSDTSGYLDYSYLYKKEKQGDIPEHEAIGKLAEIGRVTVETIKSYEKKTGGAQMLLKKGIDANFWEDIERQVITIRKEFWWNMPGSVNRKYFKAEKDGFQSWCADMWAINFALWNRGIETDITDELAFSWGSDPIEKYNTKPIYHNAGVVTPVQMLKLKKEGIEVEYGPLFFKGSWLKRSPIGLDIPIPPEETASSIYVKAIREVK